MNSLAVTCHTIGCTNLAVWLVETDSPRGTVGHSVAVCCDACLRRTERWASNGHGPPVVTALCPDEPTTLF